MGKYQIDKAFRLYEHLHAPINKVLLPVENGALNILRRFLHSTKKTKITHNSFISFDNKPIPIVTFEPQVECSKNVILFFHGGGFILKAYTKHFRMLAQIANDIKCKVIFVDYRLAPKYAFPISLRDCFECYKWIISNKDIFTTKSKIILCGDSAGGNLSIGVSALANDSKIVLPSLQLLIYPVIDYQMQTESMRKYHDTPLWNSTLNKKMWNWYLKDYTGEYLKYLTIKSHEGYLKQPRTYLEIAEYDCLHDEGKEFYDGLIKAGVNAELVETKGTIHGYDIASKSNIVQNLYQKRIKIIKDVLTEK